jgi:Restriction endonuclease
MSAADDLHLSLFDFAPDKAGAAYERLAALVLAGLGWKNVKHDTKVGSFGRRAEHQLDVTATHPDGSVRRLLVECKDWNRKVGKQTLDALVGVRDQIGFDAAMAVTTVGFTAGAVDVAVDENLAMIVLREYQAGDGPFVRRIEVVLKVFGPSRGAVQPLVPGDCNVPPDAMSSASTDDHFLHLDGSPAETLGEVLEANGAPLREGVFDCSVDFGEGRLLEVPAGGRVLVKGLKWTETMQSSETTSVTETEGEPCLVLQQLDDEGNPQNGRLVVDRHLYAWDIDAKGAVVSRGELS